MDNKLHLATIVKPQGIRGEVKVMVYTDTPEDLEDFSKVLIGGEEYKILKVRPQGDCAYIALKGVADRNAAELLRGKDIYALREDAPELPEGRFYIVDLIGCKVITEGGREIGTVCDITPAKTDIYRLETAGKDITFVAVDGVILNIDIEGKVITVDEKKFDEVALTD
jgi:16S rRNA processing protein RimM